jgi:Tol biopolymer transport system component
MRRSLIGCSVAVMPAAGSLAAAAHPRSFIAGVAAHQHNGRIVFQATVGRSSQLFTIEPDGTGLRQITHVRAKDGSPESPAWSPDGRTIAFDAPAGKGVSIFTVTPGAHPVELPLSIGAFNGDPAYSPDGTQISFDQDIGPTAPTAHGIFIANADGSGAHRLTAGIPTKDAFDTESQWSPTASVWRSRESRTTSKPPCSS